MSVTATNPLKAPAPTPDLLALDVTGLLSGKTVWTGALWQQILASLASVGLTICLVVVLAWVALGVYTTAIDNVFKVINANIKPDAALRMGQRATTLSQILRSVGKVVILFMAGLIILSKLGVNVAPILASAGIVGLAVGFGAQSLVKDVISGFFILAEDQYGVGDVIELSGQSGVVEKMNLRITQIRTQAGQLITIPNGGITTVINHSKEWACAVLEVGVAHDTDPDKVIEVMKAAGEELMAEMPDKVMGPVEVLGMEAIKDSQLVFKMTIKTVPLAQWAVSRACRRKIWYRFQQDGIEIPCSQHVLRVTSQNERTDNPVGSLGSQSADPQLSARVKAEKPA